MFSIRRAIETDNKIPKFSNFILPNVVAVTELPGALISKRPCELRVVLGTF